MHITMLMSGQLFEHLRKDVGLSAPLVAIRRLSLVLPSSGRRLRVVDFARTRVRSRKRPPDAHGAFWELEFAGEVDGPLCLGFASHMGLGIFVPVKE